MTHCLVGNWDFHWACKNGERGCASVVSSTAEQCKATCTVLPYRMVVLWKVLPSPITAQLKTVNTIKWKTIKNVLTQTYLSKKQKNLTLVDNISIWERGGEKSWDFERMGFDLFNCSLYMNQNTVKQGLKLFLFRSYLGFSTLH